MEKCIKNILYILLFIAAGTSCKKSFLEIQPKGKLIANSVLDYSLLLNNLNLINLGGIYAPTFLGDEVAAIKPFFSSSTPREQRLFKWEPDIYEPDEDAPVISSLMQNIYTYNKIINEVMKASGGSEAQKLSIRAEAQAGRAWTYFFLINYFGAPYNASTSATDPGFPIITQAEVIATKYKRSSVKEVYEFILNDLQDAVTALPERSTSRVRMSAAAAYGLLGKVYLFMGKYDEALNSLETCFQQMAQSEISVGLFDYNVTFAPGGEFLPIDIFGPTMPATPDEKEVLYKKTCSNFWILSSALVISPETVALFDSSDLRLNFYSTMPFPFGDPYPNNMRRRTGPIVSNIGITLPDLYLLRAECYARLDKKDKAVDDVEELRRHRMPLNEAAVPTAIASDKLALLHFILDERIREFASMGYRWFDMRRLSVDPLFPGQSFVHNLYNLEGNKVTYNLPAERLTLKIPPKVLSENPGMIDNP